MKSKKVTKIHLFNEIWTCGSVNTMKVVRKEHVVIHSPSGKLFHVYGNDIDKLRSDYREYLIDPAKLKIYILSEILDGVQNYNDIGKLPNPSSEINIIYDNGTIKRLVFTDEFVSIKIPSYHFDSDGNRGMGIYTKTINPKLWRYAR